MNAVAEVVLEVLWETLKVYREHKDGKLTAEEVLAKIAAIATNEQLADAAGDAAIAAKAP